MPATNPQDSSLRLPTSGDVWVLFPTRDPKRGQSAAQRWQNLGYKVAILQIHDRATTTADHTELLPTYSGYADAISRLVAKVKTKAAAVVLAHDDIEPDSSHTASSILHDFRNHFPDLNGIMLPASTCESGQAHGAWVGKAFLSSEHFSLCSTIHHRWMEADLCCRAAARKQLWLNATVMQPHQHWSRSSGSRPDSWQHDVGRWIVADTLSFLHRVAARAAMAPLTSFEQHLQQLAETLWWTLAGKRSQTAVASAAIENALAYCAENGWKRVALFGAGRHTRAAATALITPPVEVSAIIDDDPRLAQTRLWGYSVISAAEARALPLDAVIISSDAHEAKLTCVARSIFPASVGIVAPYQIPNAPQCATAQNHSPSVRIERSETMSAPTTSRIPPRPASTAPGVMSVAKDFSNELARIIRERGFTRVLETGTYDGRGSTRNFALALSATGKPWQLHTVEINPKYAAQARNNLKDFSSIIFHEGLSLARADMPEPNQTKQWIDTCADEFPGLYVDYLPSDPVDGYHKETFNDAARDGILSHLLRSETFDLILLDSAGHLGYREFELFCKECRFPCIVALDDVDHIKHAKSVADAMKDPRFTLLFRTHEKFGAAIFTFNPQAASGRIAA